MHEIEGFILMGGASRRMGTDKAALELGGQEFLARIAQELARATQSVTTVGAKRVVGHLPNVADVYAEWGALGGLHAALAACKAEWAAVVACDLPFVTGELFVRLALLRENFDVVIPVQPDGRVQPLCALYRQAACLPVAVRLIETGERRPRALLEHTRTRRVAPHELADLPGAHLFFTNVNTPEDYERARKAVPSDE